MLQFLQRHRLKHWVFVVAGGLFILYAGMAAGAYWFVKFHRHHSAVEYADIAFPWRWTIYRAKQGESMLSHGLHLLQAGKFELGLAQIRKGLERAPANRDGRLLLAQLYAQGRRPDLARQTLMEGLTYHSGDPTFIGALLRFLLEQEEDHQVISLSEQLLAQPAAPPVLTQIIALNAAQACFYRGNYDRAERFLQTADPREPSPAARLLQSRIEWERGYRELALMLLRNLNQEFPRDEGIYAQLNDYLRAANHQDEARRLAVLHQVAFPDRPRSAIDQLHALSEAGDTIGLNRAAKRTLRECAHHESGLLALGDFAASHGMVEVARGVLEQFRLNGSSDLTTPKLMVVEALIGAKRYAEALPQAQAMNGDANLANRYGNVSLGLEAIAHYGLGDPVAGYASLTTLLARPNVRTASLVAIARRLLMMDYPMPAREVLVQAVRQSAKSQPALTQLIELELDLGQVSNLPGRLRTLATMRKPSQAVMQRARKILRSDDYLFLPQRDSLLDLLAQACASATN